MKIPVRSSRHFGNSPTPSGLQSRTIIGRFPSRNDHNSGRKTFAPSTKPKFMREVMIVKEPLHSPVKKLRTEVYQEVRRVQKPVPKVTGTKPANPVIEKKAELYAAAVEKPLPQRKAVPKRKPVPRQETKTSVDTAEKPVENPEQKQEGKEVNAKESVIKPNDTKPTVKPNQDGQYELSPVMSSTLHDELQQVMIKVWQELPDEPPTEAERLVADKFQNEAGDDLQNNPVRKRTSARYSKDPWVSPRDTQFLELVEQSSEHGTEPAAASKFPNKCSFCDSPHHTLYRCQHFLDMAPSLRKRWSKNSGYCFKCLRLHFARDCTHKNWCCHCGSPEHNSLLCNEEPKAEKHAMHRAFKGTRN